MIDLVPCEDKWVVLDTDDPPSNALATFEGEGAEARAEAYAVWLLAGQPDEHELTWPERYAADASLRIFVDCAINRMVIGFDTAQYNADHYQKAAQLQADKVFALERQIRALERKQGLPETKVARSKKKKQASLLDTNER